MDEWMVSVDRKRGDQGAHLRSSGDDIHVGRPMGVNRQKDTIDHDRSSG